MRLHIYASPLTLVGSTALQRESPSSPHFNKAEYDEYKAECLSWFQRAGEFDFENCEGYQHVNVEGMGELSLTPLKAGRDSGGSARIFATSDPRLVVKVSNQFDLCSELAIFRTMNGLRGLVPKVYMLDRDDPGVSADCRQRMLVMDAAGDTTWHDMYSWRFSIPARDTYNRIYRLLEGLEAIHGFGILHKDLLGVNVRIAESDPSEVMIVDFGEARELRGDADRDITDLCRELPLKNQAAQNQFIEGFCLLTARGELDFGFWISLFQQLAADPDNVDPGLLEKFHELNGQELAKQFARVDEGLAAFEVNPTLLVVSQKLSPIAVKVHDARVQRHFVKKVDETLRRLCEPVLRDSNQSRDELEAQRADCEKMLQSVEYLSLLGISFVTDRLRGEIDARLH